MARARSAKADPEIRLYLDTSGKEHEHRAVTAAGYLARAAQWAGFGAAWRAVLADSGSPEFHATDFFSGRRAFAHLDPKSEHHRALALRFAGACYKHLPNGFAYTIDVPAYRTQMTEVMRRVKTPTARLLPSTLAVSAVCNRIAQRGLPVGGPKATMLLEAGDGTGEALAWLRHLARIGEPWTAAFLAFDAVPKETIGTQAADLLAYESWREASLVLESPNRTWTDVERDTFKVLATGPTMLPPAKGEPRVDMQYASAEHFPEWERGFAQFLDEHARYRRSTPGLPRDQP